MKTIHGTTIIHNNKTHNRRITLDDAKHTHTQTHNFYTRGQYHKQALLHIPPHSPPKLPPPPPPHHRDDDDDLGLIDIDENNYDSSVETLRVT